MKYKENKIEIDYYEQRKKADNFLAKVTAILSVIMWICFYNFRHISSDLSQCLLGLSIFTTFLTLMFLVNWQEYSSKIKKLTKDNESLQPEYDESLIFQKEIDECVLNNKFFIEENSKGSAKMLFIIDEEIITYQRSDLEIHLSKISKDGKESLEFTKSIKEIISSEAFKILNKKNENKKKEDLKQSTFIQNIKYALKEDSEFNTDISIQKQLNENKAKE